jgi:hypothetical protein
MILHANRFLFPGASHGTTAFIQIMDGGERKKSGKRLQLFDVVHGLFGADHGARKQNGDGGE